jgi:hypothetical protein
LVAGSGSFKTINFKGQGMLATVLQWYGSTSLHAIRINGLKQYIWEGFLLENKVAKGTTVGVLVQRDSGTGTQSGACTWRNIRITDFAKGVQVGNVGITQAGSEFHFDHLMLERNDTGLQIQDFNSLNFLFSMLETNACGTGLQVLSGGSVIVNGGAAGYNTVADFDFGPASNYAIKGVRSEHANRFLIGGGGTSAQAVHVSGCNVVAISNADGVGVRIGSGPINLIGNNLLCKVALSGASHASAIVHGNAIADTAPVDYSILGGTGAHYDFKGNRRVDTDGLDVAPFADETGHVASGVRVPAMKIPAAGVMQIGTFTTATRPTAASYPGAVIYVSDGAGGSKFQGSDGSSWVSLG